MRGPIRLLSVIVLAATLLLPRSARAQPGPVSASATSGSVKLTLSLDHEQYPQNALVLVTLTVTNVGKTPVSLQRGEPQCGAFQPAVQIEDAAGRPSQLPTAAKFAPMPCPVLPFLTLAPGHSLQQHPHVVLSGPQISASQTFGSRQDPHTVTTPPLAITLTKSSPIKVTLQSSGPAAVVQSLPSRLYYTQSAKCAQGNGTNVTSLFSWTRTKRTRITPPCTPVSEWHLIAGYPGKPVATLDYKAP
jgi:hypothetical protein